MRVLLRPCVAAASAAGYARQRGAHHLVQQMALRAHVQSQGSYGSVGALRWLSSVKDKKGGVKPTLHDRFDEDEQSEAAIPAEVEYVSKESIEEGDEAAEVLEEEVEDMEEGDGVVSAEEWAAKFEEEVASWGIVNDEEDIEDLEDDRLQIEMPNHDPSLLLSEESDESAESRDFFGELEPGMAMAPEMLNWMLPKEKREIFRPGKEKPWKYFVNANHKDIVELALDVELLRLFISPTGRIRPRRFTGLTAKQQRKLARAVKVSKQLALLPMLSRYPEPSPEQWKALQEEELAKLMAEAANDDNAPVHLDEDDDQMMIDESELK